MEIDILSLFPEYFRGPFDVSMIKRAQEHGILKINHVDIRAFSKDKHQKADDRPFGGGPGMILLPEPTVAAIRSVKREESFVIYLSPQGKKLSCGIAEELSKKKHLILLCGHYEGIDERIITKEVDEEISIGDYVLTNGCLAAIVFVDVLVRYIPHVLGHPDSVYEESFQKGYFDAPHYTRPVVFEGIEVPSVLRSGNHADIAKWRQEQGLKKTKEVRPDLFEKISK